MVMAASSRCFLFATNYAEKLALPRQNQTIFSTLVFVVAEAVIIALVYCFISYKVNLPPSSIKAAIMTLAFYWFELLF
jgi:hypothetical protein